MAVNPIQFLVAQNASITDGTKTITISGNVDCSRVYSGTAIFLGGADNPAEAVSGTSPDGSGNSTITLRNNWSQGDIVNQQLVSFNTNEGLAEAISNVREIVSNVSAIEDLATQGLIKRINDNEYEVVSISALGEALVGASDASSARTVLGLGSAATKNVGTSSGNIMEVGAGGLLSDQAIQINDLTTADLPNGFYKFRADINGAPQETAGSTLWYIGTVIQGDGNRATYNFTLVTGGRSRQFIGERIATSGTIDWREIHSPTTTKIGTFDFTDIPDISGFYAVEGSTNVLNAPQTSGNMQILNLSRTTTINGKVAYASMLVIDRDTAKTYVGSYNISRSAGDEMRWYEVFSERNSVNPLDYGLKNQKFFGGADLNTLLESGFYITETSGISNTPNGEQGRWNVTVSGGESSIYVTQLAINNSRPVETIAGIFMRYSRGAGIWSDWQELYHSGNSVNPLDYGLGTSDTPNVTDWNTVLKTGFYKSTVGGGQVNSPDDSQAGWYGTVTLLNSDNVHQMLCLPSGTNNRVYVRTMQSGTWSSWEELYHSGNTNFNEFGGNSANDIIAVGEAVTSTVARFYFPLQSKNPVNSFTLIDTVNILKGSATIATGLTEGSITLSGLTSSKIAVLDITTSGLTVGDLLNLRTNTASASIQFNV